MKHHVQIIQHLSFSQHIYDLFIDLTNLGGVTLLLAWSNAFDLTAPTSMVNGTSKHWLEDISAPELLWVSVAYPSTTLWGSIFVTELPEVILP